MKTYSPKDAFLWLRALWRHHQALRWSREELEARQLRKFRELVAHANLHSPYYRAVITERGIDPQTCLPTDFPVLTKQEVMEHLDDIVTDRRITRARLTEFLTQSTKPEDRLDGKYHVMHTSGSSGQSGWFVFSHQGWITGASLGVQFAPLRWRQRTAYVGVTRGHFGGVSLAASGNDGFNSLFYDIRNYDVAQPLQEIIDDLNAFQPKILIGYATMIKLLAEAQEQGRLRIRPQRVGTGAEPLLPEAKTCVERAFQTKVINIYATTEHLYMGITLPGSEGLRLMEQNLMFELRPDCLCVTNLFNEVMPLIRYRMNDVLTLKPEEKGRPYPFAEVAGIVGRQENTITFTNERGEEDYIHPIVIVELLLPGVRAWQFVVETRESFRFRACFEAGLTAQQHQEAQDRIRRELQLLLDEKNMRNVRYEIDAVDSLPVDPKTGKFRLVLHETN